MKRRVFPKSGAARIVALVFVIGIFATGAYAFTASNTVTDHQSGAGVGDITGYTVDSPTNYVYNNDGTKVDAVTFDLDSAATDVKAALVTTPGHDDWANCGASGGSTPFAVTCNFKTDSPNGSVLVANVVKLHVVAVSSGTVTIAADPGP
jgi:hypothetical protein